MAIFNTVYGGTGGGGGGWQPGANTIAYYPLTSTTQLTDQSGNNRTLSNTNGSSPSFGNYGGIDCMYVSSPCNLRNTNVSVSGSGSCTVSGWYYLTANPNNDNGYMFSFKNGDNTTMNVITWGNGLWGLYGAFMWFDGNKRTITSGQLSGWHHYVASKNGSEGSFYCDGVLIGTITSAPTSVNADNIGICSNTAYERSSFGYFSNVIFEDKARTADEVSAYFNQTKGNYGL